MPGKKRLVHYLNQFFGQIGGEEEADIPPRAKTGPVGPGVALQAALGDSVDIVGTVICGDNYINERPGTAVPEVMKQIRALSPDIVVVGPAFNAGRYGLACGMVAKAVSEELNLPVVGGMFPENPGIELYRQYLYAVETGGSAAGMRKAVGAMAEIIRRLVNGEEIGTPEEEGYIPRGLRKNVWHQQRGAERAVGMLLKKIRQEPLATEYPMPRYDRVTPAPPIQDMSQAKIALITTGGIVPSENPDRIESSSASHYGRYNLYGMDRLPAEEFQTVHGGYDPTYANQDPNRVLPLDAMRILERDGVFQRLYHYYFATVGNGTSVAKAARFATDIAVELKEAKVDGVILTST